MDDKNIVMINVVKKISKKKYNSSLFIILFIIASLLLLHSSVPKIYEVKVHWLFEKKEIELLKL